MDTGENIELQEQAQKIIEENRSLFEQSREITDDLLANADIQNIGRYYKHLDKLTGIYGRLNVEYKKMRALKKNEEARYFNSLKVTSSFNNERFVAEVAKQEASCYIAPLRTARDLLEGYVESCTMAIGTCKSRIYEYRKDQHNETGA